MVYSTFRCYKNCYVKFQNTGCRSLTFWQSWRWLYKSHLCRLPVFSAPQIPLNHRCDQNNRPHQQIKHLTLSQPRQIEPISPEGTELVTDHPHSTWTHNPNQPIQHTAQHSCRHNQRTPQPNRQRNANQQPNATPKPNQVVTNPQPNTTTLRNKQFD